MSDLQFVSVDAKSATEKCDELAKLGYVVTSVSSPFDVYTSEGVFKHITIAYLRTMTEQKEEPCSTCLSRT